MNNKIKIKNLTSFLSFNKIEGLTLTGYNNVDFSGNITLELLFKIDKWPLNWVNLCEKRLSSLCCEFCFRIKNRKIGNFYYSDGKKAFAVGFIPAECIKLNEWCHFKIIKKLGHYIRIYSNGKLYREINESFRSIQLKEDIKLFNKKSEDKKLNADLAYIFFMPYVFEENIEPEIASCIELKSQTEGQIKHQFFDEDSCSKVNNKFMLYQKRLLLKKSSVLLNKKQNLSTNTKIICDYMHYAFLPQKSKAIEKAQWYLKLFNDDSIESFDSKPSSMGRLLEKIIRDKLSERKLNYAKVAASTGFDSRGIVGGLLKVLPKERIMAYTMGQKGNPDFEKGELIYGENIPNYQLILTKDGIYSERKSVASAMRSLNGVPLQLGACKIENRSENYNDFDNLPIFHGFLGDAISGKRLPKKGINTEWSRARTFFVKRNFVFKPLTDRYDDCWLPYNYNPYHVIPNEPLLPFDLMCYDDQLDLCYRQNQRVRYSCFQYNDDEIKLDPHILKYKLSKITVYDDPRWQKYFLTMDIKKRIGASFYHEGLAYNYPELFPDLVNPQEFSYILKQKNINKYSDFLDKVANEGSHSNWELLYCNNTSFRNLIKRLINSLSKRKLLYWMEPNEILKIIDKNPQGMSREIFGLASVEINIRAGHLPSSLQSILN